ncbi:LamG domain-containing protein [Micromonospora humida]|uniref:LamG domain-containing protein n=1 Tax=Micromonospora humida TaxID=2809018 RepID=UPI0033CAA8DE
MTCVLAGSVLTGPGRVQAAPPPAPPSVDVAVAPDAASAVSAAQRSGRRVEVESARTELTQVFANPSGGFTAETAVMPQRVKRSNGSWADIDLSLRRSADGWAPAASVAQVRFSAGGRGPAVVLSRGGRSLSLSWPGGLPRPTVSGDAATYPNVLPGTDLVLRATRTGFTHVLVVRTPQAAADPRLRELRFAFGGGARVTKTGDGRLSAVVNGQEIATAEPALMWDSSTQSGDADPTGRRSGASGTASVVRSSAAGPGDRARTAPVGAAVADGHLVLRPDARLLAGRDVTFPVFIDPAWSTARSRWAYATQNNTNNTDTTIARVGKDPDSGKIYRSYFDFPLSAIRGKHIESAYVQMKLDHSWSCTDTPTYMYHSSGIASTPRTAWAPKLHSQKATAQSHANEGYGCSDSPQPDMTVNFTGSSVTSLIQTHATNNYSNVTLGFCACSGTDGSGESTTDRWKKFWPNSAKLVVDYDSVPGAPYSLQTSGVACAPGQRISIGTLTPTFSGIFPDADTTQALTTAYEWLQVPSSGTYGDATPRKPAPSGASVPAGGRSTTAPLPQLTEGQVYAFRARATDPAPYSKTSAWSAWCEFRVDTTIPPVVVTRNGTDEPLPGEKVTFGFSSTDTSVTKFRYGWTFPGTIEVPATTACSASVPAGTNVCYRIGSVSLSVPKYGQNTLHVRAYDGAGNPGDASAEFIAGRPSPAIARWGLETLPGVTTSAALADGQPALGGNTPLTASNVGWTPDMRIIKGATSTFNGTSSSLHTTGPVVDTTKSYGVAAWVRLSSLPTENMAIATQAGDCMYGFFFGVYVAAGVPKWDVTTRSNDCAATATYTNVQPQNATITNADVGRWQHVAFSYDEDAKLITLYVNGASVATAPWTTAWNATNGFQVGRNAAGGLTNNFFQGSVAQMQVYNRALVPHDFTGQRRDEEGSGGFDEPGMLKPVRVGQWTFDGATGCYEDNPSDWTLCMSPENTSFGRRIAFTKGVDVGDGSRASFLSFDSQAIDDPTQPTVEYGRSQDNVAGDPQNPNWQDGRVLRTDQSFSVSAWVQPRSLGIQTAVSQIGTKQSSFYLGQRTKIVSGNPVNWWSFSVFGIDSDALGSRFADAFMTSRNMTEEADLSHWTHLVGVHDVAGREVRLYVDGKLAATTPFGTGSFTGAFDATGPLYVGAARFTPFGAATQLVDRWDGDIDDVSLYQGALSDNDVRGINETEAVREADVTG